MKKRIPLFLVVLLVASSGCATTGSKTTETTQKCTPKQVQGPVVLTTESGLSFEVPDGFSATDACEWVSLDSDEFDVWTVEIDGKDLEKAIGEAWAKVLPGFPSETEQAMEPPAEDPWDGIRIQAYVVDENGVFSRAVALRRGDKVYVQLVRATLPVLDKRYSQISSFNRSMKLPGVEEEDLTDAVAKSVKGSEKDLDKLIKKYMEKTGTPGMSLAIVEDGRIAYSKGYGVRKLGEADPVNADTLMMIGSVTKSMTTLMMATLVDEGKLSWDAKVKEVYPGFALGDAELAQKLEVQHLVCACAGLPRKDMVLALEHEEKQATDVFKELSLMKPSTGFKETYQYQNHMVAAGGYVAALSTLPEEEPRATYLKLMNKRVFGPIGMKRTTLDIDQAVKDGNYAMPHSQGFDGEHKLISLEHERFANYISPSGGIWSTAVEMASYIITEMNGGVSPDGVKVVSKKNLEKRWEPQVALSKDVYYGLGWIRWNRKGILRLDHNGGTMGFATFAAFYPEKKRGVVMISNGTGGHLVEALVFKRLDEIWFGLDEKVDETFDFAMQAEENERMSMLKLTSEPTKDFIAPLLGKHANPELGEISIEEQGSSYVLDAGTYRTKILKFDRPDGKVSLICVDPPLAGVELVVASESEEGGSLILERGQERYVLTKSE